MSIKFRRFLGVGLLSVCYGCSLAPDYKRPEMQMPSNFKEISQDWVVAKPADQMKRGSWWKNFGDPILDQLVTKTEANNFQIAAAVARYENASAFLAVNNAGLYPQIAVTGATTENRQSAGRPLRGANQPNIYDNNFFGGLATYEVDLWGRVRSGIDSASALAEASQEDLESVRLIIQADLVSSYIAMRGVESQQDILQQDLSTYQKQADLMQKRYKEGINPGVDFYRVQGLVESGRIREKALQTRRAQLEHVIAVLVGESPSSFSLPRGSVDNLKLAPVAVSIPSTLLERRPDVASAERRVAASNAEIGVARSAFFPVLSLSAFGGYQTANQANILAAPNAFWTIGPLAFLTIFDGGRRSAIVDQAVAKNAENTAVYKNTVLVAIKEVEDVLVQLKNREESLVNVENSLMYAEKTYKISTVRYREGVAGYLEIVDAAIDQSRARTVQVDYQTQLLIDRVLLIKALGGYW
ncbi:MULTISPECIES: efflux transporter outer membrane subunit [unclassified Polynucleobacter]|uniref:efflux transporter outer membrane subunit n=1 Tax=unclassified Polynucleobacter TaxID=2640945 RepID=UPI001BFD8C42|nr:MULTISPECIES: efflux transporter outer membrane subunit [unclassified Polynucleobacter]MEA9604846.1 efflux transporter outer membrane subunit [Polynucleobacter sp. JS-JIR-II-c23]QWE02645.1 efflux transporter outer membrane subunit [Polynucleobacter sp. JS-JIR-II-b4]